MNAYSSFSGLVNVAVPHAVATVSSTSTTLAALGVTIHADTKFVGIMLELSIRATFDGATAATAAVGDLYPDGTRLILSRAEALNIRMIRATGADAKLQITQYVS